MNCRKVTGWSDVRFKSSGEQVHQIKRTVRIWMYLHAKTQSHKEGSLNMTYFTYPPSKGPTENKRGSVFKKELWDVVRWIFSISHLCWEKVRQLAAPPGFPFVQVAILDLRQLSWGLQCAPVVLRNSCQSRSQMLYRALFCFSWWRVSLFWLSCC